MACSATDLAYDLGWISSLGKWGWLFTPRAQYYGVTNGKSWGSANFLGTLPNSVHWPYAKRHYDRESVLPTPWGQQSVSCASGRMLNGQICYSMVLWCVRGIWAGWVCSAVVAVQPMQPGKGWSFSYKSSLLCALLRLLHCFNPPENRTAENILVCFISLFSSALAALIKTLALLTDLTFSLCHL